MKKPAVRTLMVQIAGVVQFHSSALVFNVFGLTSFIFSDEYLGYSIKGSEVTYLYPTTHASLHFWGNKTCSAPPGSIVPDNNFTGATTPIFKTTPFGTIIFSSIYNAFFHYGSSANLSFTSILD